MSIPGENVREVHGLSGYIEYTGDAITAAVYDKPTVLGVTAYLEYVEQTALQVAGLSGYVEYADATALQVLGLLAYLEYEGDAITGPTYDKPTVLGTTAYLEYVEPVALQVAGLGAYLEYVPGDYTPPEPPAGRKYGPAIQ